MKVEINEIDLIHKNLNLENIKVLSFINKGNFGKVFYVYDIKSKKKMIMKLEIRKSIYQKMNNLLKEYEIIKNINHINIIKVKHYDIINVNYVVNKILNKNKKINILIMEKGVIDLEYFRGKIRK